MSFIGFPISALVYTIIVFIVHFSKKRISLFENNFLMSLMGLNLIGLFLELSCYYVVINTNASSFLEIFILKSYVAYIVTFNFTLNIYLLILTHKEYGKKEFIAFEKFKKYLLLSIVPFIIIIISTYILPLHIYAEGGYYYTFGPSVDLLVWVSVLQMFIWMKRSITSIWRNNNKSRQQYAILVAILLFGIVGSLTQFVDKRILIITSMHSLVLIIMYFTIENPDMKLIAQLNEAKSQAEKANSAKTDFLSSMSHEIRTPLNAIVGFSQALSEEDLPNAAQEEVKDIISASESLLDIVNGILDISKIEANKLEIIDKEYSFKKIFDELVALTKARMGDKPLDFRYSYDNTIPDVLYGDNVRVKQVILNLLTNSVKYTKHGFVDFKVNSIIKDDVCRLIISVEDSGIGIKKENIEKLFTKFERFDEKNTTIEGTGLGLAITKKLVNLMNGKIVVQSVYGKGSRFTIAIDQKIVKGKTLEDIGQKLTDEFVEIDATGYRILVVDDNKLNLKVATRLLTGYKAEIVTIDSGFECIDRINNGEKFDLILMDDMMPKMSGVETIHKLHENPDYNIPTIALTANAIEGMKEKYLSEGFDDYLSKPIDKLELNNVINKYLNKN